MKSSAFNCKYSQSPSFHEQGNAKKVIHLQTGACRFDRPPFGYEARMQEVKADPERVQKEWFLKIIALFVSQFLHSHLIPALEAIEDD